MKLCAIKRKMSGVPDPCTAGCRVYFDRNVGEARVIQARQVGRKPSGPEWKKCAECDAWCRLGQVWRDAPDRGHEATSGNDAESHSFDPAMSSTMPATFYFTDENGNLQTLTFRDVPVEVPDLPGDAAIRSITGRMRDPG